MCIYAQLIKRYSYELSQTKQNKSNVTAISEFNFIVSYVQKDYGDIADIEEIRQLYIEAINEKTNWGYKQLTKVLEAILEDYR